MATAVLLSSKGNKDRSSSTASRQCSVASPEVGIGVNIAEPRGQLHYHTEGDPVQQQD